jgi:hypothetical protein
MGLSDRIKEAAKKAEEAASEHRDQMRHAVVRAGEVADQRTKGKYSEQIQKAAAKADTVVERIAGAPAEGAAAEQPAGETAPGQPHPDGPADPAATA